MPGEPNEDLIEATIRRVAEAKAAREAADGHGPAADLATPADADDGAPSAAPDGDTAEPLAPAPRAIDEDLINATIRRVTAARATEQAPPAPADAPPAPTPIAAPPRAAARAVAAVQDELLALRREVAAMQGMLSELQARVDGALSAGGRAPTAAAASADDDGWDDAPVLPRLAIGQPPRPPIVRAPVSRGNVAEALDAPPEHEPEPAPVAAAAPARRGFDLLPRTYRVTVEDKRRGVDLVPLHRALLAMDGVRDMSLLSYSNGVAIVSVEMVQPLEQDVLRDAVAGAMMRPARVESHNETTMVVKLAEE